VVQQPTVAGQVTGSPAVGQFDGDASLSSQDDAYNNAYLRFTSGALNGQARLISDYVGASKTFTFATPFSAAPAANDQFVITRVTVHLKERLASAYTIPATFRIADLQVNQTKFRLEDSSGIEPGSYVQIGAPNETCVVASVQRSSHFITLERGLTQVHNMAATVPVVTQEFALTVGLQNFPNLSMDPRHSRYFRKVVDSEHATVEEVDPPNPTAPPNNMPAPLAAATTLGAGSPGVDDDIAAHTTAHYVTAIDALEKVDAVNLLCIPDCWEGSLNGPALQASMIAHCEKMQDRFAILDPQSGMTLQQIRDHRNVLQSDRGFASLYYPRIKIRDPNPLFERNITVPPSGHIAGVCARTDDQKGVHKAPANEAITGVIELERVLTDVESGLLNEQSVNVLRRVPQRGFRVWGARTLATSTQWRYVNVRRLMLFIEESLQEGTEFAVFEPNNQSLWKTLERQVKGFLTGVWQTGALFGETPEKAFRVRIDEELNPSETIALGQLHIEVIVFPTTPAEFIVFRIIQEPGGPRLVEL
jgi:phage tail sheath protein FI